MVKRVHYFLDQSVMKSFLFTVLSILILSTVYSEEYTDYAEEPLSFENAEALDNVLLSFWNLEADWNWIAKAKFTTPEERGNKIGYNEGEVNLAYARFLNACDGIAFGIGYTRSYLDWTHNPFFHEKTFSKFILEFQGFTKRLANWDWRIGLKMAFDTDHFDIWDHTMYDFLLWGRYGWQSPWFCQEIGLNIGFLARTGIDKDWVIPIIGIDLEQEHIWKIHFIYPVDMNACYYLSDNWAVTFAGRLWNTRYRVNKNEPLSEGIFEYRNSGIELGILYEYAPIISANVHIGSTLGNGDIKISDKNDHTIRHNKFKSSIYAGGSLNVKY